MGEVLVVSGVGGGVVAAWIVVGGVFTEAVGAGGGGGGGGGGREGDAGCYWRHALEYAIRSKVVGMGRISRRKIEIPMIRPESKEV